MIFKKIIIIFFIIISIISKSYSSKTILGSSVFNATDVTIVIQNAFYSSVDTVFIQNVGSPWIVKPLFIKRDNFTLILDTGVVIQAKSGAFTSSGDCLLSLSDGAEHRIKNINIIGYNATLKMLKNEYTEGEHRHCLNLLWSENVFVSGLTLYGSGGDGIYLGRNYYGDPCLNVIIKNCIADNNRRQGISIISVDGLLVENCIFKNTKGTAPEAGLDIEPDAKGNGISTQIIKNVLIRNCQFTGNAGHGIAVALHEVNEDEEPVSIKFENCFISTCGQGISVITGNGLHGFVQFDTCTIENTMGYGLLAHATAYSGVDNPVGTNPKQVFSRFTKCSWTNVAKTSGNPIEFQGTLWRPDLFIPEYGGTEFIDCYVGDNKKIPFLVATDGPNSFGLANVEGSITVKNNRGVTWKYGSLAHDINLAITEIKDTVSGIKDEANQSTDDIMIYPNPVKTILHIKNIPVGIRLDLYNLQGNKIILNETSNEEPEIDVSIWPRGIYLLKVESHIHKIIIQ